MDPNEAAAALADIGRTQTRLADRARWSLPRHAMFGLVEGLVVAALAQPVAQAGAIITAAMILLVICVVDDRRRHGMFVSGWQRGATLPLTIIVAIFVLAIAMASVALRDKNASVPVGYLLGAVTFVICTLASLRWEKVYRADLVRADTP